MMYYLNMFLTNIIVQYFISHLPNIYFYIGYQAYSKVMSISHYIGIFALTTAFMCHYRTHIVSYTKCIVTIFRLFYSSIERETEKGKNQNHRFWP